MVAVGRPPPVLCGAFPRNLRGMTKENRDETMHRFLPGPGGRHLSHRLRGRRHRGGTSLRGVRHPSGHCAAVRGRAGRVRPAIPLLAGLRLRLHCRLLRQRGGDPVGGHCLRPELGGLRQGPGAAERRPVRHSGDLGGGLRLHPHRRGPDCHGPGVGGPGGPVRRGGGLSGRAGPHGAGPGGSGGHLRGLLSLRAPVRPLLHGGQRAGPRGA